MADLDADFKAADGLRAAFKEVYPLGDLKLLFGPKGQIKACEHNAKELLAADSRYKDLHFDEFLSRVRIGDRDLTDHDDRDTLCWLQAQFQVPAFTLGHTRNAVMTLAYSRRRDSLRDFVLNLPEWDGTARIEMALIDAWGAEDTPLVRAASRNLFIAMHARAVQPGAQVDTLWSFENAQGTFKSKSMRELGGRFHSEISAPIGTTDFYREMRGVWLAELSEADSIRGREASTVKRILSAPVDRFVEKYEKHAVSYPRRAVAVATTNEQSYWQDPTGARRLVPTRTGEISITMIEDNREAWFSEARALFDKGATWWEFPAAISDAQESRQQIDPWEDILRGLVANGRQSIVGHDPVTKQPLMEIVRWPDGWIASAEIMSVWLKLQPHQQGQACGARLGRVLRRLGFRPGRSGKARERGWEPDTTEGSNG